MVAKVLVKRTSTPNSPPATLDPGELAVEMADPLRLWVGVPTNLDPSGKKLLVPLGGVVVSETPPVSPAPNTLWWESDTGILWLWYTDADSSQWVQAAGGLVAPPAFEPVASGVIDGVSFADIAFDGTYEQYRFVMQGHTPATDGTVLFMRFSFDGGLTFVADPTAYGWTQLWSTGGAASGAPVMQQNQSTDSYIAGTGINLGVAGQDATIPEHPSLLDISMSLGNPAKGYQPGLTFSHRLFFAGATPAMGFIAGVGQFGASVRATHMRFIYTSNALIMGGYWQLYGSMK